MKKLSISIILVSTLFFMFAGVANAVPMYISLEGQVETITTGPVDYTIGSTVNFLIMVDFDRQATIINTDGLETTYVDPYGRDTFFAEFINGNILQEFDPTIALKRNIGIKGFTSDSYPDWFEGCLNLSTSGISISIQDILPAPEQWEMGGSFGFFSIPESMGLLEISSISYDAPTPVPEPASVILFCAGLAGLSTLKRKRWH